MSNRVEKMSTMQDEALNIFRKRHTDYAEGIAKYGVVGALVRVEDTIQSCLTIRKRGIQIADGDKLSEALLDLMNYSALALVLMDDKMNEILDSDADREESKSGEQEKEENSFGTVGETLSKNKLDDGSVIYVKEHPLRASAKGSSSSSSSSSAKAINKDHVVKESSCWHKYFGFGSASASVKETDHTNPLKKDA